MLGNPPTVTLPVTPWLLEQLATAHDTDTPEHERTAARDAVVEHVSDLVERETGHPVSTGDVIRLAVQALDDDAQRVVLHLVVAVQQLDREQLDRASAYLRSRVSR